MTKNRKALLGRLLKNRLAQLNLRSLVWSKLYKPIISKKMKKIVNLSIALILVFGTVVLAQPDGRRGGDRRAGDPTERAKRLTTSMTELLNLDEDQQNQVGDLNLEYAMKIRESFQGNQGDREAMRETMVTLNQEKEEKLTTMLSEEQMQLYQEKKEEFRKNSRERRGKRRGEKDSTSE